MPQLPTPLSRTPGPWECVCGGGGGYGGASRLQRQALASQYPDISVERKKGPRGPRGGRGGLQSSVAELCAGEGEARAPFQPPGVWGLRDVRREQGGVTIQQRSGRTTKPSGGGGAERGHRGEPPPPPSRGLTTEVAGRTGSALVGGS